MFIAVGLFIVITILSLWVFKVRGLFLLFITVPLMVLYIRAKDITKLIEKGKNFLERKEVEFVKSNSRRNGVKPEREKQKKKVVKNTDNRRRGEEKKKSKKEKKNVLRTLITVFLSLVIIGIFCVAAFLIYIVVSTGDFDPEALKNADQTIIYDKDGKQIKTLGDEKRETVTYDKLPQVLIDALIATEDSRFYQHNGVDMARFLKASLQQLLHRSGGGASTLTMQVVKNNLTDTNSEGIEGIIRKFKDVYLSVFFMEPKYSKQEILEMYVNDSGLGGTIYGVEEASKYYFGKSVTEITLPEAALLVGMYQAPSAYNPYNHPEAAYNRRARVLELMVRHGYITEEEEKMANAVSIESMLSKGMAETGYQGYIDMVIEEVIDKTGYNPSKVSMKIYTALDRSIQDGIDGVLNGTTYSGWVDDEIQAGIAVVNVNDGTIVAVGAGRNRKAGDWNNAIHAHRQPGSTAKPIFDYGPGIEYNNFSTYTLFNDEPWGYTNGPEIGNWDGGYQGLITLRNALAASRNIPALKAFQMIDKKNIANFANGLGLDIAYSTSSDNYTVYDDGGDNLLNEAYAIGGVSHGFTPLEMAEAYACFANGGYHIDSHAVVKIEYRSTGEVVEFNEEKEKVMSDSTAYLINNILQYAVDVLGTGGGSRRPGYTVAAKTGTSNMPKEQLEKLNIPDGSANDLWTVAYTPEYAVSLWYGYKQATSTHYLGNSSTPKDRVMEQIMKYIPMTTKTWTMPSSVVAVAVESGSWPAKIPSEYTPSDLIVTEYFKKGTQPTEVSERFAKLNSVTNLKQTKTNKGYEITWNWKTPDVLDSAYLSKYFSNSVFGNESARYLKERIDYNNNNLGGNGFAIYQKTADGGLKLLDFTTDQNYLFVPTSEGKITLVVRAEYKNFKVNASDGVEIVIQTDGTIFETDKLEVTLNGGNTVRVPLGTYKESGLKITYSGKEVTTGAVIAYDVNGTKYTNENDMVKAVNAITDINKEITIKYTVTYQKKTSTITRKVIFSDDDTDDEVEA